MIVIPAVDIRGGKCVRLLQGDYNKETVYSDSPADQALKWEKLGGRFLHLVDLDAAKEGKPVNIEPVSEICSALSIPCEIGGGIRNEDDLKTWFDAGVERVIIGTAACENPEFVTEMLKKYGSQKIVLGIDAKAGKAAASGWIRNTGIDAFEMAANFAEFGIKRIIFTDIETDGMLSGPNIKSMARLCDLIPNVSVIASGGVSSTNDILNLKNLNKANLEGVIVGKALYTGKIKLDKIRI